MTYCRCCAVNVFEVQRRGTGAETSLLARGENARRDERKSGMNGQGENAERDAESYEERDRRQQGARFRRATIGTQRNHASWFGAQMRVPSSWNAQPQPVARR